MRLGSLEARRTRARAHTYLHMHIMCNVCLSRRTSASTSCCKAQAQSRACDVVAELCVFVASGECIACVRELMRSSTHQRTRTHKHTLAQTEQNIVEFKTSHTHAMTTTKSTTMMMMMM